VFENRKELLRSIFGTERIDMKGQKVKQSLLQAWTGPEVSRRLRLSDFKTIGT